MSRYFTKPKQVRAGWVADDDIFVAPMINMPTVSDHEATDTGLLSADGDIIWRAPNHVGFIWNGDYGK